MKQFLSMESLRIASILILLFTCSVSSFPSRPLNERSADLAWQAWLLVDDQNQEKNYDTESLGRRRITPKSVFIAPTFSPESLPPCASGYQSDAMGRCVKLIEIDQEAHLEYLLEKLNERFGGYEELSEQETSPSGPLQLNIPLDESRPDDTEEYEENVDVAIVVAPTNGNFNLSEDENIKSIFNKNKGETGETQNVRNSDHRDLILKSGHPTSVENQESSSSQTSSSTEIMDGVESTTSTDKMTRATEPEPETSTTETSSSIEPVSETTTHILQQHALFFREPIESNSQHPDHARPNRKDNTEGTPLDIVDNDNDDRVAADGSNVNRGTTTELSSTTFDGYETQSDGNLQKRAPTEYQQSKLIITNTPSSTELPQRIRDHVRFPSNTEFPPKTIRFPHEESTVRYQLPTSMSFMNLYYQNLPMQDEPVSFHQRPNKKPDGNLNIYADRFKHIFSTQKYIQPDIFEETTRPFENGRFVFKNRDLVADANFQRSLGLDVRTDRGTNDRLPPRKEERCVNCSTISKSSDQKTPVWSFSPPPSNKSSPHKPLILRFPQRHGSRRLLSESMLQPLNGGRRMFLREISPEDMRLIFGNNRRKRKSDR